TATKKKYQLGDEDSCIVSIKKRLYLTGDYTSTEISPQFNHELEQAIKNYQHRYGFKEDGSISVALINEMNRPVTQRIQQMLINMERLRWVPATPPDDYLLVNIPEFVLHVFEKGKQQFKMNVVVGTQQHNSVIFTGKLKNIVFSPYWNIPVSIVKKEIVPGIKKNPNYIKSHNMEITGYYGSVPVVRQKPGIHNSLGLVKFLFPNSYDIYFHDTPSKSLFNESKRAFSHGCIRLGEPAKLAKYLLRNDPIWDEAAIKKAMNSGKEKYVIVKPKLPVFIGYFTAWVDNDGLLNFRDDIYGHDAAMAGKMFVATGK
ncbi:MAG: L,D-transpeptidase family protein, partial [Bacteroidota bacterium]